MRAPKRRGMEACSCAQAPCLTTVPTWVVAAEMVAALCSHANDGATAVRRQITESLVDIGRKQPNLVLSSCLDFLRKNMKVRTPPRAGVVVSGCVLTQCTVAAVRREASHHPAADHRAYSIASARSDERQLGPTPGRAVHVGYDARKGSLIRTACARLRTHSPSEW